MKRWLIVSLIALAFVGLVAVQVRLLWIGVLLEMNRFDREIYQVLQSLQREIAEDEQLLRNLNSVTSSGTKYYLRNHDALYQNVEEELRNLLTEEFMHRGITARFSFALISSTGKKIFLRSGDFRFGESQNERYKIILNPGFNKYFPYNSYFHLYINNLFQYLLQQLAYLIIPSLLFMVVLLVCFVYLLRATIRLQRLDRIKNDFINNLTHELKTPVFSISLISRMLRESVAQKNYQKLEQYLPLLNQENEKLKGHIDKVLELASMESGRYHLQREKVDLHELLRSILGQYGIKVEMAGGNVQQDFAAPKATLRGDYDHLTNAIHNLLENALKYNTNTPKIIIRTANEHQQIVLLITDNGIGIAAEHQKAVFEKFYRITTGNLHEVKGFGLGLHYVKHIIEAHSGQISVRSQPGLGSTFKVVLPVLYEK